MAMNTKLPPGPRGKPLVGNTKPVNFLTILDHREKYGDISRISIMGKCIIVLNSIDVIREVCEGENSNNFSARPDTFARRYYVKHDVIFRNMDAENHAKLRELFSGLIKEYGEGKVEMEKLVNEELRDLCGLLSKQNGKVIDLKEFIEPSLINANDILLLGQKYEYDHWRIVESRDNMRLSNKLFSPATDSLMKTFTFLRHLPFGPGKLYRTLVARRNKHVVYCLETCRKGMDDPTKIGLLVDLYRMRVEHPWITDENILGIGQDSIGKGYLTARNSLYAFFLIMLHYPDVQTKIQAEIDDNIGKGPQPSTADRHNMPYTLATMLELTRFTSVASVAIPHACSVKTNFREYMIPKGAIIMPNLFRIHHDEQLWNDPWVFDPTRFLDDDGGLVSESHVNRQNLIPFGVGKRACIAQLYATNRMFLYITSLLQVFTFTPADNLPSCDPRKYIPLLMLTPEPYNIKIQRRN